MCYDLHFFTKKKSTYSNAIAKNKKQLTAIQKQLDEIEEQLTITYHTNGFSHPNLLVWTGVEQPSVHAFRWGLIPSWVKDEKSAKRIQNQTLNARAETVFEKPAFRNAAKSRRCIVIADGFFEHYHYNNQSYPFHVQRVDQKPMLMAGIWEQWLNPLDQQQLYTVSIVTTKANALLTELHNNPKLKEPRMPFILDANLTEVWLSDQSPQAALQSLAQPLANDLLTAQAVRQLRGKNGSGNHPRALEKIVYEELGL